LTYEDRLKNRPALGASDCHHGQQAEQQHTGRRHQHGQQLRELNSEENHESFPSLTAAGRFAGEREGLPAARIASKSLSGGGHPL
jgi:hypothetical protein